MQQCMLVWWQLWNIIVRQMKFNRFSHSNDYPQSIFCNTYWLRAASPRCFPCTILGLHYSCVMANLKGPAIFDLHRSLAILKTISKHHLYSHPQAILKLQPYSTLDYRVCHRPLSQRKECVLLGKNNKNP